MIQQIVHYVGSAIDPAAFAFSIIGSLFGFSGYVAHSTMAFEKPVTPNIIQDGLLSCLLLFFILYLVSRIVYMLADRSHIRDCTVKNDVVPNDNEAFHSRRELRLAFLMQRTSAISFKYSIRKYFLFFWFIILLCWIPWVIIYWPGALRDDTIPQMFQSLGLHRYYTQHPIFDTLIFGIFWHCGEMLGSLRYGLAIYTVCQTVALSFVSALSLCYLRKIGVPRLFAGLLLAFISTSYVVAGAVPTMSKDSLHALFMVPFSILFVEICRTRGSVLRRPLIIGAFIVLSCFVMMTKRTGLEVVVCASIFLFFAMYENRKKFVVGLLIAIALVQLAWLPLSQKMTDAEESPNKEIYGLIIQPLARVQAKDPDKISVSQHQAISNFADLDRAGKIYNPTRTDEATWTYNPDATISDKLKAVKVWFSVGTNNIVEYAKAYVGFTYGWSYLWQSFSYPTDSLYLFNNDYMKLWGSFLSDPEDAESILGPLMEIPDKPDFVTSAAYSLNQVGKKDVGNPLCSMGLYVTYLPLMIISYLVFRKQWIKAVAWTFLGFFVLALYLSPMALFWYPISVYFMLPIFGELMFCRFDK
ncbi:DUF6020 family protein [Bifidobacterium sp. UTCIF-39]|uniref:DUF6020 family protein n=1 Tax=Bifidobacterium sp. UTCIF-39 TaxID=1465359 RepID=UPI001128B6FE|nr:DUF6020 family protein [Bifidobacterium sp. UTCIF-39]